MNANSIVSQVEYAGKTSPHLVLSIMYEFYTWKIIRFTGPHPTKISFKRSKKYIEYDGVYYV